MPILGSTTSSHPALPSSAAAHPHPPSLSPLLRLLISKSCLVTSPIPLTRFSRRGLFPGPSPLSWASLFGSVSQPYNSLIFCFLKFKYQLPGHCYNNAAIASHRGHASNLQGCTRDPSSARRHKQPSRHNGQSSRQNRQPSGLADTRNRYVALSAFLRILVVQRSCVLSREVEPGP